MSDPKVYTVGCICALQMELVAACQFLDHDHGIPPYVSRNDTNAYTLGEIGAHKVVIAILPAGEYGIGSAASAARDMLHSLPNIRIGLMVGIGGGAPSATHDTRLGDVVVSSPGGGKGGIFQYDFGKTIQDQEFSTTKFLNQAPALLRTAIVSLNGYYRACGHKLPQAIVDVLSKRPFMDEEYRQPDPSSDRVYKSTVVHAEGLPCCADACGTDEEILVHREVRKEGVHYPIIHYGTIASANQLMKNATIRDEFAEKHDVLCFEIEAAGLMNHFPCLVIRGICD